jgi:hypothetical protein
LETNVTDRHRASEVFGITRELPLNYVTRSSVDVVLVESLTRDHHVVIFGGSKQGKTSLRKFHLSDAECIVVTCSNRWTLSDLNAALLKGVGFKIQQSTSRSQSGGFKVSAKLSLGARLFGAGIGAEGGAESDRSDTTETTEVSLELDPSDTNEVIAAIKGVYADRWFVLEDFHYLPEETQKDFAVALKAFHENSKITFIVVGVWLQENRLTQLNGDLSGRVLTINADLWKDRELFEAISLGETLLNVHFPRSFKEELVSLCDGSIYVVQASCLMALDRANILFSQDETVDVPITSTVDDIVREVVDQQSGRYRDVLMSIAAGFGSSSLEMYKWILLPLVMTKQKTVERGLRYRQIRRCLDEYHPNRPINAGNLTQALGNLSGLQALHRIQPVLLNYDSSHGSLRIVDRSFLIWLKHQDKLELLEALDLPIEIASEWRNDVLE